jgi:hypothetical protein
MVITIFSNQDIGCGCKLLNGLMHPSRFDRPICGSHWAAKAYQYIGQLIKLQPDVTRSNVLVLEC